LSFIDPNPLPFGTLGCVKPDDIFHVGSQVKFHVKFQVKFHVKFQVKFHVKFQVKFHVKKTEAELSGGVNQIFCRLRKLPVWLPFSRRITGWMGGCAKTS
jgi:hypothetical protein